MNSLLDLISCIRKSESWNHGFLILDWRPVYIHPQLTSLKSNTEILESWVPGFLITHQNPKHKQNQRQMGELWWLCFHNEKFVQNNKRFLGKQVIFMKKVKLVLQAHGRRKKCVSSKNLFFQRNTMLFIPWKKLVIASINSYRTPI